MMTDYKLNAAFNPVGSGYSLEVIVRSQSMHEYRLTSDHINKLVSWLFRFNSFLFGDQFAELYTGDERVEVASRYADAHAHFKVGEISRAMILANHADIDGAIVLLEDEGDMESANALRMIFNY